MSTRTRLLNSEADFLKALSSGGTALDAFDQQWAVLRDECERAQEQGTLSKSDLELAVGVASRIGIVGDAFAELYATSAQITSSLLADVETILTQLSLDDVVVERLPSTIIKESPEHNSIPRNRLPPYVPSAYAWMLYNLHNPYPPSSLKRNWAKGASLSTRAMDDWFKAIRKKIGWVTFTKSRFKGSRCLAVSAAESVLLDDASDSSIPFEVQADLLSIRSRLDALYRSERGLFPEVVALPEQTSSPSPILSDDRSSLPCADPLLVPALASPRCSLVSRTPSLVFDRSDSEEDERLFDSAVFHTHTSGVPIALRTALSPSNQINRSIQRKRSR